MASAFHRMNSARQSKGQAPELRKLLIDHSERPAKDIDYNAPPVLRRSLW